ncbi:MAG: ferredoxin--NADP reductase [bacterium]|nr:ferredoxin--NADP reductase [bacterium]
MRRDVDATDPSLRALLLHVEQRRARARQRLAGVAPAPAATTDARRPAAADGAAGREGAGSGAAVLRLERPTPDLLRVVLARPPGFTYRAGQSVRLVLGGVRRRYTLVSAPHERDLELFVELVPGGPMSERWRALRPGDAVGLAGAAKDGLALAPDARRHLMLATVTGVNPFVSLLRDAVERGRRDLGCVLVHGASYADELGYADELAALAAARPDLLVYLPTISRPGEARNAGWTGAQGRAEAHLDAAVARHGLAPATTAAYACGHPAMIDGVQGRLGELGFTVQVERYA